MKPKWMRWHTFNRYAARDAELANREWVYFGYLLGRQGGSEAAAMANDWAFSLQIQARGERAPFG